MMGGLSYCWNDVKNMTLAQLQRIYQTRVMLEWNHTADIVHEVACQTSVISHIGSKEKPKFPDYCNFHPYLKHTMKKEKSSAFSFDSEESFLKLRDTLVGSGYAQSQPL